MAKKEIKNKFEEKTLEELLSILNATEMIFNYYDNLAQSNMGCYDGVSENEYIAAKKQSDIYFNIKEDVFKEIKSRIDEYK